MAEPIPEIVAAPDPVTPVINRASFATSTTRALAEAMTQANDPISVQRRWALIAAVNSDDTVNITLGGELVEGIAYDAGYTPTVGEHVYLDIVGADVVVMGTMAPSLHNPGERRGTVTSISADRETVNVTVDDGSLLTAVPVLSSYNPVLNDQVHLSSYRGSFLVIGSLDRTAQTYRRAVGDIEPSLTVKPGTLALNGQVVSRMTYANLWAWVQANNLVTAGMFTAGDGSTTFGLPDLRGRTPVGVGTLGADTYALGNTGGSARTTLATAQMPSHNHSVTTTGAAGAHNHAATTSGSGSHSHSGGTQAADLGHTHGFSGTTGGGGTHSHTVEMAFNSAASHVHSGGRAGWVSEAANPVAGTSSPAAGTLGSGDHSHGFSGTTGGQSSTHYHAFSTDTEPTHTHTLTTDTEAAHTHTITETTVGGTTAVDLRSPYLAIHWVIWL